MYNIETINKNGYVKICTVKTRAGENGDIRGGASFDLDINNPGQYYKINKDINLKYKIKIYYTDINNTDIRVYYDKKDILNFDNNSNFKINDELLKFVTTSEELLQSPYIKVVTTDIYVRTDPKVLITYSFSNISQYAGSYVSIKDYSDCVTSPPTSTINTNIDYVNLNEFRNKTNIIESNNFLENSKILIIEDYYSSTINVNGYLKLKSTTTINDSLFNLPGFGASINVLSELFFVCDVTFKDYTRGYVTLRVTKYGNVLISNVGGNKTIGDIDVLRISNLTYKI